VCYRQRNGPFIDLLIFTCNRCADPVFLKVARTITAPSWADRIPFTANYVGQGYAVIDVKPEPEKLDNAPAHTPTTVRTSFEQACRALSRGDYDIAGMGFRKTLDVATKHLVRHAEPQDAEKLLRKDLYSRIEWLHDQSKLTPDIKEWAHNIRRDGNDAAHEEAPYEREEADQLHHFTQVFLMYVFMMPGLVAKYKQAAAL
jgi:hypothetical protein